MSYSLYRDSFPIARSPLILFLGLWTLFSSCSGGFRIDDSEVSLYVWSSPSWKWVNSDREEAVTIRKVYEEQFGDGNSIRLHQSMCVYGDVAFCFNDGEECRLYDIITKERYNSKPLPDYSHHNNAQFSQYFYDENDKYPLLFLSRGDYPPNQNDFYIVRVSENEKQFSFSVVKTIHNTIQEAQYGGSWVVDEEHGKLYLYCMTTGDWRTTENNYFCIFSFELPDVTNPDDVTLGYEDVLEKWVYTYLIPQGGAYFNGYLFFNVQSLQTVEGENVVSPKSVIAINTSTGHIDLVLPLGEIQETEGICIFDNKLFVSFKEGSENQSPTSIVFILNEYSLPTDVINRN